MSDRALTFAEVEEALGLAADEVRALMESGKLRGRIVDGVVKFDEAEVRRLAGRSIAKSSESHFKFLVDEEEEARIEGKAYEGEPFKPPKKAQTTGEDEEIVEPMGLTDEQLHNADLLGGRDILEFGREVAEKSVAAEFSPAELRDEEIFDPSKVELPEPPFGPLAERIEVARHEAPVDPPAPVAFVTDSGETVAPPPVKPSDEPPPKMEFVAEAAAPMVCPVPTPEEAPVVSSAPPVEVPIATPEPAAPKMDFEAEAAAPMVCPVPMPEAAPVAPPEPPVEVLPPPPAPNIEFVAESVPPVELPREGSYEVELPVALPPVTLNLDLAADEETAEEPPATPPPSMLDEEEPAKPTEAETATQETSQPKSVEEVTPIPPVEVPAAASAEGTQDVISELERELAEEEARKERLPLAVEKDTIPRPESVEIRKPAPKASEQAAVSHEEAKPVTDEMKKRKNAQEPKKKPEDIEVFDVGAAAAPAEPTEDVFEILEEEPAAAAEAGKEKSLEDEMAELFGEEVQEAPADQSFAQPQVPPVEEDFDLSVFQKGAAAAAPVEPAAISEDTLFEVNQNQAVDMPGVHDDLQGVSRIRAVTEERTPMSTYLYTAAIILGFAVVAFAGMILWRITLSSAD